MAVHGIQQRLAGLLAFHSGDLKQLIQLVLSSWDFLNDVQLLGVQDVQHVIKNGLQVTWVQTHLPEDSVFLLCGRWWGGNKELFKINVVLKMVNQGAKNTYSFT